MKKMLIALLVIASAFFALVFSIGSLSKDKGDTFKVAMVTDYSDVNDESFNQACFEAGKEWCKKYGLEFNYYKPASISEAERIKSIELAIDRGYDVILCPGYALGNAIAKVAPVHPEVKFIGIDIIGKDFPTGFQLTDNISVYSYEEGIAGFLAGYGVVKDGFRKLGFLGGMSIPSIINFANGYIQGIDAAAQELKENVNVHHVYADKFYGTVEITKYIDNWYKSEKTDIVFSCGGSIYTSVALAAKENNRYMIGVDSDQAPIIDKNYKEGICITSAMKGIRQTVLNKLEDLYVKSKWEKGIHKLGLVSKDNLEENYVELPLETWRMNKFSIDEYKNLVGEFIDGKRKIVDDYTLSEYTSVTYYGEIN